MIVRTSPNRAYLATVLRTSAQICSALAPQTSDMPKTLGEIGNKIIIIDIKYSE